MSKRIFSEEQINEVLSNKNVLRCSDKSITYHKNFKIEAVRLYQQQGVSPRKIFKDAGFNLSLIGPEIPKQRLRAWLKLFKTKGVDGMSKETRGGPGRRRSLKKPNCRATD